MMRRQGDFNQVISYNNKPSISDRAESDEKPTNTRRKFGLCSVFASLMHTFRL